jgi:3-oxoacyl-[acyl-carrier protein] reductase
VTGPESSEGSTERVVLVTGAASGMGAACARRFALDHRALALFDLQLDRLGSVARDVAGGGAEVEAIVGDITAPTDVASAVDRCVQRFGRLDILVNAAGIAEPTPFLEIPLGEWRRVIEVNLTGAFLIGQAVARSMRERAWGRIVHFSSTAGKTVSTLGGAHYTAAKHGVLGLTRASAKDLAPFGITVNAVCPGLIDTDMARRLTTSEDRDRFAGSFPISRLGSPEEVADLVRFLASDAAGYITGAAVDINGGDLMV